jgi:hypothetical protein
MDVQSLQCAEEQRVAPSKGGDPGFANPNSDWRILLPPNVHEGRRKLLQQRRHLERDMLIVAMMYKP